MILLLIQFECLLNLDVRSLQVGLGGRVDLQSGEGVHLGKWTGRLVLGLLVVASHQAVVVVFEVATAVKDADVLVY